MEDSFFQQIRGLLEGGVDVLLIETQQDLLAIKCALAAANRAFANAGRRVPIMVQASMDQQNGREMLTGSDPTALVAAMMPFDEVDVLGLNLRLRAVRADRNRPLHLPRTGRDWSASCPTRACRSSSNGKAHFPMSPPDFTKGVMRFVEEFGVNIVGGCCGTMPEHLKLLCEAVGNRPAKTTAAFGQAAGVEPDQRRRYPPGQQLSIVAERTNTNGSRQFKRLLQEDDWDGLVEHGPR